MKSEGRTDPKGEARKVLVCFAVKEEARAFQKLAGERGNLKVILVGMGKRNAERAIRAALAKERPQLVLTCGFAGGLRPDLAMGTVVFAADPETGLEPALLAAGAKPARFTARTGGRHRRGEARAAGSDRRGCGGDGIADHPRRLPGAENSLRDRAGDSGHRQRGSAAGLQPVDDAGSEAELRASWRWRWLKSPGKIGALLTLAEADAEAAARKLADGSGPNYGGVVPAPGPLSGGDGFGLACSL